MILFLKVDFHKACVRNGYLNHTVPKFPQFEYFYLQNASKASSRGKNLIKSTNY